MEPRRLGTRIPVALPAQIRWKSRGGNYRKTQAKTENISGNGMFMTMPTRLRLDTPIVVTLTLPAKLTHVPLELRCEGRVVRWSRTGEVRGIAATIEDYDIRPRHPRE